MKTVSIKTPKPEIYITLVFLLLMGFSLFFSLRSYPSRAIRKNEPILGMVIGCDNVAGAKHSDTIILLSYLPGERFLNLLFIPRDTKIDSTLGDRGQLQGKTRRINEIYAYSYHRAKNHQEASIAVKNTVQELLSTEERKISVPYYCQVDYPVFVKLIDLIGGVPIKIDKIMDYHDNWGNLHIHFEPGEYVLSGQKALEYVRYRDETGDTERTIRQQRFLRNLLTRLKNPLLFFRLPLVIRETIVNLHTNLSFWDILNLPMETKDFSSTNLRIIYLPGKPEANYWVPDREKIKAVKEMLFFGALSEIKEEKSSKVGKEEVNKEELLIPSVTAEVYNATAIPGLALRTTRFLRRKGIDVVKWGNYGQIKKSTLIIDRSGNSQKVQKVASALCCNDIITNFEPGKNIDVSIILGEDYLTPSFGADRE